MQWEDTTCNFHLKFNCGIWERSVEDAFDARWRQWVMKMKARDGERYVRMLIGQEGYRPQFLPPCRRGCGWWRHRGSADHPSSRVTSALQPWSSPLCCWCSDSDAATRIYKVAIPSYSDFRTYSPAVRNWTQLEFKRWCSLKKIKTFQLNHYYHFTKLKDYKRNVINTDFFHF